jgi:hypothetical protein
VEPKALKVLDLRCASGHVFEGWFASEEDFVVQLSRSLVQCPFCGDPEISKQLSAPRLLRVGRVGDTDADHPQAGRALQSQPLSHGSAADPWLALAKAVMANTTDVGARFADEARKIYYGESQVQGIRGIATPEETRSLLDEGIDVIALQLPTIRKEPIH